MKLHRRNLYAIAERLGMTVGRLSRELTIGEYFGWVEFLTDDKPAQPVLETVDDWAKMFGDGA